MLSTWVSSTCYSVHSLDRCWGFNMSIIITSLCRWRNQEQRGCPVHLVLGWPSEKEDVTPLFVPSLYPFSFSLFFFFFGGGECRGYLVPSPCDPWDLTNAGLSPRIPGEPKGRSSQLEHPSPWTFNPSGELIPWLERLNLAKSTVSFTLGLLSCTHQ